MIDVGFLFLAQKNKMLPSPPDQQLNTTTAGVSDDISLSLTRCPLCGDCYQQPKVLACFHTFCKPCLEKLVDSPGKIICPQCHAETQLCANQGVDSLLTDYALANIQEEQERTATAGNGTANANVQDQESNGKRLCFFPP